MNIFYDVLIWERHIITSGLFAQAIETMMKRSPKTCYKVESGAIVGTTVADSPNTFLCTKREFGDFVLEFEEAALVTLGLCYQQNGRFSGGVYHPVLKRCDKFSGAKLPKALEMRRERAAKLLELNDAVNAAVSQLKSRGFESPYLKAFVVARINPLRFQRKPTADFDETIDKMIASAQRFDAGKIKADQVARSGGPPAEEG